MKNLLKSPYTYFSIVIAVLMLVIAVREGSTPVEAKKAPIDAAAIAIGDEIQGYADTWNTATAEIARLSKEKARVESLASAKDVELCGKYGLSYVRATGTGATFKPGSLNEDANCPLQ